MSGGQGNDEADGCGSGGAEPPPSLGVGLTRGRRGARPKPSSSGGLGCPGCDRLGGEQLLAE
jgi:hypothetical protein